jgi:long-chain acyl-CoA synthetase
VKGDKPVQDTLATLLVHAGERYGERLAAKSSNGQRTYSRVLENAARVANVLRERGLEPGDRVAMMLENRVEAVEVLTGITVGGFVIVPVNGQFKAAEVDHVLKNSGARALIHTDGVRQATFGAPSARDLAIVLHIAPSVPLEDNVRDYDATIAEADPSLIVHDCSPSDLAIIGYTSGTTGFPKGVMVTHQTLALCVRTSTGILRVPHYSRLAFIGSLGYAAPWWTILLPHLYAGGMVNLITDYTVDSWFETMAEDKTTFTFVPSPLIDRFVAKGREWPDVIAQLTTVNHSASAATRREIEALVGLVGAKYFHGWGATEIVGAITCLTPNDSIGLGEAEDRWRTVGRPAPTCRLFVLDDDGNELARGSNQVGEFAVEMDTMFSGYWQDPEATAAAFHKGRYLTGDVGYVDHAGYAYIVDRKRDMIVSGGANVYPAEVERVLRELDGVADIAVFGIPHEQWGETVAAAIVLRAGSPLTEDDVVAFARENMASFKKPTSIRFLDELPRNASQKVVKDVLRRSWATP